MDAAWSVDQRAAAKELFGRPARVALAAWVLGLEGEPFYLQQAQDALAAIGESRTAVSQEVQLMKRHGMLDSYQDGRRVYFVPIGSSAYWEAFEMMGVALGLLDPADRGLHLDPGAKVAVSEGRRGQ